MDKGLFEYFFRYLIADWPSFVFRCSRRWRSSVRSRCPSPAQTRHSPQQKSSSDVSAHLPQQWCTSCGRSVRRPPPRGSTLRTCAWACPTVCWRSARGRRCPQLCNSDQSWVEKIHSEWRHATYVAGRTCRRGTCLCRLHANTTPSSGTPTSSRRCSSEKFCARAAST